MAGRPVPQTPLVRAIDTNFIPTMEIDDVRILVCKGSPST
jgi:hypothetical protein